MCECPSDKIQKPCARLKELELALELTEALLRREREKNAALNATLTEARGLAPGSRG